MVIEEKVGSINDYLVPDGWPVGGKLVEGDAYVDSAYVGSQFRVETGQELMPTLPVNLTKNGKSHYATDSSVFREKCRVKIEFVQDGEPSHFHNGWLYYNRWA